LLVRKAKPDANTRTLRPVQA